MICLMASPLGGVSTDHVSLFQNVLLYRSKRNKKSFRVYLKDSSSREKCFFEKKVERQIIDCHDQFDIEMDGKQCDQMLE